MLLILTSGIGCDAGSRRPDCTHTIHEWGFSDTEEPQPNIPGLTAAKVEFALYKESVVFILWADTSGIRITGGTWDNSLNMAKYTGHIEMLDKRQIPFECTTPDGKTGTFIIEKESLQLKDGTLFLVSTLTGKVNVKQLDGSGLSPRDARRFQELRASHLTIRAFFLDAISQARENAPGQSPAGDVLKAAPEE